MDEGRQDLAKRLVFDVLMADVIPPGHPGRHEMSLADVYVVWFCKTLQNWKALLSTDLVDTGIYFEVTYNGDKREAYVDHYRKVTNRAIQV